MSISRRTLLLSAGAATAAALFTNIAVTPAEAGKSPVYTGLVANTAVGGYDPVAYFKQGKPVRGSSSFTLKHQGVNWRFSSAANRDAFKANPARYAPAFGGYCAWAVSQGYTAKGDPRAWKIVGGKLYLNYNRSVQKRWERNQSANIRAGNRNWPKVLN